MSINIVEIDYNTDIKTCIRTLSENPNTCFILFVQNMKKEAISVHSMLKQFENANLNLNVINLEQFINAFDNSLLYETNKNEYIYFIKQMFFHKIINYV